ncbi:MULTISPECIES: OmpA family protein [Stenotrophomonas]|uniref:OmpA family protein n=1 Tax=Stenotrophomonas TaxID=40323 RepID=UPI0015DED780|nr:MULTISPECIES: OmpA family protein [Stenotrophomonas]MBA0432151.1 OmpA family protein [Stenotrophomonas maltophilia]MDH0275447.1 OmpA family protein [Stenotrophomonas sp. GD04089]MDH1912573.1 OmpA family protein [Stenotrophomonas sp. GD03794]UQA72051.1 OmpA family protein [Stenotrophomonas maltophilia]
MQKRSRIWLGGAALVLLAGCNRTPAGEQAAAPPPSAAGESAAAAAAPAGSLAAADGTALTDRDGKPVPLVPFDTSSVPLSDTALGGLPFFSLPQGYAPQNAPHPRAWARFPFRMGEGVHWVEGPSWSARIVTDSEAAPDKAFSALEVQRNFDGVITAAGGRKVFEGKLLRDIYYGRQLEGEIGGGFIDAVNGEQDAPTTVYVLRQANRTVWVQLAVDSNGAGLVVVDDVPFKATAQWSDSFPHLSLPAGYRERNTPEQRDFDAFPFWTGDHFEPVEGRTFAADFDKGEREYSMHEVRRNLEAMMAQVNGTKVFEGRIPHEAAEGVSKQVQSSYGNAASYSWDNYDTVVYRVDLADGRQVWVHARLEYLSAGWVVVERKGFTQTAALLPADALKKKLDSDGRVAIQVNFATDKAQILPTSEPQLAQVLDLLRADPSLKLSIEGHTDNSGAAAHNRSLSEDRARSVVAALTAKGIAADRLQAAGFGADRPVADNGSEQGKARNRRVELVKR